MEASHKKPYKAPSSEAVAIRTAGIICTSGETDAGLSDYNKQPGLTW
jgi:hypothetical protein